MKTFFFFKDSIKSINQNNFGMIYNFYYDSILNLIIFHIYNFSTLINSFKNPKEMNGQ